MNIKINNYMNQTLYTEMSEEKGSNPHGNGKIEGGAKPGAKKDTVSISIEGQLFAAKWAASDSEMGTLRITSDLDSFRHAIKSTHDPLPVNWEAVVDPYGTFRDLAKVESRLRQLQDPEASHQDEDMEKAAEAYAKSKIDILIEKKKALTDSGKAKSKSEEHAEYKTAYDAYHSANGDHLIAKMTGDAKKAYNIYKGIIDGNSISIEDEEFLMLHNRTMYVGAKGEYLRKSEKLYRAMNGITSK